MNFSLLLSLLLLGTVSSLHLKALEQEISEGEKALLKDLAIPEEGNDLALEDGEENDGEEVEAADNLCPKEENVIRLGTPGCKTCRFLLVKQPKSFNEARRTCRSCYRGHLVSIHSFITNYSIQCSIRGIGQGQIWIGGQVKGRACSWTDGSPWTYTHWASGQPRNGGGHCVALCTQGGYWRRKKCTCQLPFACAY